MTDELTLVGRATRHRMDGPWDVWVTQDALIPVEIRACAMCHGEPSVFRWSWAMVQAKRCFPAPELARDAAEATLRALHTALGDVVEPWVTERDPPPPTNSMCDEGYLCTWDSEYATVVGEAKWDGTVWYGDGHSILNKPYAWRPMPKAPDGKGPARCSCD